MPDPIMTATMIQVVFISPRSTEQMLGRLGVSKSSFRLFASPQSDEYIAFEMSRAPLTQSLYAAEVSFALRLASEIGRPSI
jgi:hypothetical protein